MTTFERGKKRQDADTKMARIIEAFRKSDEYLITRGAAEIAQVETEFGSFMSEINADTATDDDTMALKAWRVKALNEFNQIKAVAAERATLLEGKTELPG